MPDYSFFSGKKNYEDPARKLLDGGVSLFPFVKGRIVSISWRT